MSLDVQTVKKVAKLARLKVSEDKLEGLAKELSSILDMVAQLDEVNTDNVEPMTGVSYNPLPMRKDEVTDGGIQPDILANAPEQAHGFFVVPKVVE